MQASSHSASSDAPLEYGTAAFFADPYPTYARLREMNVPCFLPTEGKWLISRYRDVSAALKNPLFSKRFVEETRSPIQNAMLFQDPPDHTRLRGLVNQAFTPNRVKDLEPRIVAIADAQIDLALQKGYMDFIADFALPIPVIVIAEMLGVPQEDRAQLHQWSVDLIMATDEGVSPEERGRLGMGAVMGLTGFFTQLIEERRARPKDDILSAMIAAQDQEGRLSEGELIGTAMLLLIAGHETTVNLFGNGLYTLLRHPEQWNALKQNPDLLPSAIDEMLRYESPVQQGTFRIASAPIQIGDMTLEAGAKALLLIGAANRDPEVFPDPDRFDITRTPNRHLGFGLGIHFCMGAALARTETRLSFTRLLERLPNLRFASEAKVEQSSGWLHTLSRLFRAGRPESTIQVPEPAQWKPNTIVRGLQKLPVTW